MNLLPTRESLLSQELRHGMHIRLERVQNAMANMNRGLSTMSRFCVVKNYIYTICLELYVVYLFGLLEIYSGPFVFFKTFMFPCRL
jgi:hypothetical protein